jgi:hypothetical protein
MTARKFIRIPEWGRRLGICKDSAYKAVRPDRIAGRSPSVGCAGSTGQRLLIAAAFLGQADP